MRTPHRLSLDVLVPTHERPVLLRRTLDSLLLAPVPPGLEARVVVLQNDANPDTDRVIADVVARVPGRVTHLREPRPGKSRALNTGIQATRGDLIAVIDDDEAVDPAWLGVIQHVFQGPEVDFIGGPCLPRWGAVPPHWLPRTFGGVIGYAESGDRVLVYGQDADGILMGGNAVMRRRIVERAGLFQPALGPRPDRRLLSGEDEEFYRRLLGVGAHGLYVPDLRIYHYVPPERLTKRYYRRWCFWHGVSRSVIEQLLPSPAARVGRVPRYLYGDTLRALVRWLTPLRTRDAGARFADELHLWRLAGFVYGSYWRRDEEP